MIRRDVTLDDGRPGWALVSQVEHARIAMEMARAWSDQVAPLPEGGEEFIAAVYHHDDGWIAWELRPTVHDGMPRDFMEMPLDESLAIWRRSIAVAHNDGPLAGYAVSRHFATLCGHSHDEKPHDATWRHLAEEFLEEQADLEQDWKREISALRQCGSRREAEFARVAGGALLRLGEPVALLRRAARGGTGGA